MDGEVRHPRAHDEIMIRPGQKHRFWALSDRFSMIVVSFGHWEAGDQIRHEDDYGREVRPLTL